MTNINHKNKNAIIKIDNYDDNYSQEYDPSQSSNAKAYSDIFKEMLYLENLRGLRNSPFSYKFQTIEK